MGNTVGKVSRFRRVTDSAESPNGLTGFLKLFHCVLHTPCCSATFLALSFRIPGFLTPSEFSTQSHMLLASSSFVWRRSPSMFFSTPSPRRQTSLVSRHVMHGRCTSFRSNPSLRPQKSPRCHCALPFKNSRLPSTPKIKLPIIRDMSRTLSVLLVIGS